MKDRDGLFINLFRIFDDGVHRHPFPIQKAFVKTMLAPSMAGNAANLLNLHQDHIVIAVEANFFEALHVTGFFTFTPQFLCRIAVIFTIWVVR